MTGIGEGLPTADAAPGDFQIRADGQQQVWRSEQTFIHLCGHSWTTQFSTLYLLGVVGSAEGSQLTKV